MILLLANKKKPIQSRKNIILMKLFLKSFYPIVLSKNPVRSQAQAVELSNKFWKPQQHSLAQPNQVASSIEDSI